MADLPDDRSLGDLLGELSRETATLVRKEIELATTELTEQARTAGRHASVAAAGGALAHAGLLILLAALVIGLAQVGLTPWLAALLVGVATIGIGYLMVNKGLAGLRRTRITPTNTVETLKENARWTTGQRA